MISGKVQQETFSFSWDTVLLRILAPCQVTSRTRGLLVRASVLPQDPVFDLLPTPSDVHLVIEVSNVLDTVVARQHALDEEIGVYKQAMHFANNLVAQQYWLGKEIRV